MSTVISENEFNTFCSLDFKTRANCMEAYLIGLNNRMYNMEEVGSLLFNNKNYSFTISLLLRCYNFSGKNGGNYKNGCSFEKKYGYRVSRQDIEALLSTYPDGIFNTNITFEQFLISRVNNAININQPQSYNQVQNQNIDMLNNNFFQQNNSKNTNNSTFSADDGLGIVFGIGAALAFIILVIMLFTGNIFHHWIISLICLFIIVASFSK